jgi:hypothetical protein
MKQLRGAGALCCGALSPLLQQADHLCQQHECNTGTFTFPLPAQLSSSEDMQLHSTLLHLPACTRQCTYVVHHLPAALLACTLPANTVTHVAWLAAVCNPLPPDRPLNTGG